MASANRSYSSDKTLHRYLKDIGNSGVLSQEEEIKLAKKIRNNEKGSKKAMESLIKANLRFVITVAKKYQNQGLGLVDLINEGNMGLIKAAIRFDETKGYKFISYAVWWIKQAILQALSEQSRIVRLPLNRIGDINKLTKMTNKLEKKYKRKPTKDEISEHLNISEKDIENTLKISSKYFSLDRPVSGDDGKSTLLDMIEDEDRHIQPDHNLLDESLREDIDSILDILKEKEKDIIILYFGLNDRAYTLKEIGEKYSLTRERVRQIKEKALGKLKSRSKAARLRFYLGE